MSELKTASPPPSFLEDLNASLLEQGAGPFDWMLLSSGDSDPFDSIILFGFEPGQSAPAMVAKVPRLPGNTLPLRAEYEGLSELWSLLGEEQAAKCLPRPVALLDLHGQPALVITHITGESQVRAANRGFWSKPERAMELVRDSGRALRRLHDLSSRPLAETDRSIAEFTHRAVGFSRLFSLSPVEQSALSDTIKGLEAESLRARREVLLQGDFWHGNLIRRPRGGELVFVDWQFAHWSTDVSTDVYFFLLAAAFTGAAYGTGPERARGAAARLLEWRSSLIPAYLEAYGQPSEFILLPIREGMLAACIEKAVRPAMDFGYSHPDDLMWRLLFTELASWPAANGGAS